MTIFDSSILAFAVEFAISHFYLSFSWKKQKEREKKRSEEKRRTDKNRTCSWHLCSPASRVDADFKECSSFLHGNEIYVLKCVSVVQLRLK